MIHSRAADRSWTALGVLCLGVLMIAMSATTVSVALPSMAEELRLTKASLVWVANAYFASFGGFLILGGRLGDHFGRRRLFLVGIALFAGASLACGLAVTPLSAIAARFVQGLGGAVMSAVALSQIVNLFEEPAARAKALGIYVFVGALGSSVGVLLGGILTSVLSWRWVFLMNVPIGALIFALCILLLPRDGDEKAQGLLDVAGAMTATSSLMIVIYAILDASRAGWISAQTFFLLTVAGVLLSAFAAIEARAENPLVPLGLFRTKNFVVVNAVALLFAGSVLAGNLVSSLYLQNVLRLAPHEAGMALLPANLALAMTSLLASPALVARLGAKVPLALGILIGAMGLALLANASVGGSVFLDVIPGTLLLAIGTGLANNPLLCCAVGEAPPRDSGAASGIVSTALMAGGALGLSLVISIAAARTDHLIGAGTAPLTALNSGYQAAFLLSAALAAGAAVLAAAFLARVATRKPPGAPIQCVSDEA